MVVGEQWVVLEHVVEGALGVVALLVVVVGHL